jgi:hypothetical protein
MMANLRPGGCGRLCMHAFIACMEVVWRKNPKHVIDNIKHIMEDVSCKMGLLLLKHFSNPDTEHPNNYWGNLDKIKERENLRQAWEYGPLHREDVQEFRLQRRRSRFQGRMRVLEEFVQFLGPPFENVFEVVQPKACVMKRVVSTRKRVLVPKTKLVEDKFNFFLSVYDMLQEFFNERDFLVAFEQQEWDCLRIQHAAHSRLPQVDATDMDDFTIREKRCEFVRLKLS